MRRAAQESGGLSTLRRSDENATADTLQAISDIDSTDRQVIEPPKVLRKKLTAIIPVDAA